VKPRLREVLAESHVAAASVVVFLLWSLDYLFRGLWEPLSALVSSLYDAVAIYVPYFAPTLTVMSGNLWMATFWYLFTAFISFSAAWFLSRWVFGVGPLRCLSTYSARFFGRDNA